MALNASSASAPAAFGWQPHWPESQRLAESLRCCRLTLLCGAAGSGKSSLLAEGLMPLLQRRAVDAALRRPRDGSPVIMPFPERRSAARARLAEIVILFDAAGVAPLDRLHERIDEALRAAGVLPEPHASSLPDRVQALADRWGTKFLFVFDRFEELLKTGAGVTGRSAMLDELVALLNRRLPAHVLVALRSEDHALLEPFERRLQAVDPEMMVLPSPQGSDTSPPTRHHLAVAPAWVERSAAEHARWHQDSQLPLLEDAAPPEPPPSFVTRARHRADTPFGTGSRLSKRWRWQVPLVLAPLAMVAFALPVVWSGSPGRAAPDRNATPDASTLALAAPTTQAARVTRPALDLQIERDGATAARLPAQLAKALAADAAQPLNLRAGPGGPATLAALAAGDGPARLAVVRYDALQAAARATPQRPIAVVAPLYTEEIHVVVRADSTLRYLHEIGAQRINIGAADSARALTAGNLYRRLFGAPVPQTADGTLDATEALQRLVSGQTLDVVVLVAAKPADALAALPAGSRRALKLLRLAPDHPASARALQAYLPATAQVPGGAPVPTLAAMAFMVTSGAPDAASSESITRFTQALCGSLPGLQARGDAKWREVQPGLQLPTPWPVAAAAEAAWADCRLPATATPSSLPQTLAARVPPTPTTGDRP